jgi:hypothetical protein
MQACRTASIGLYLHQQGMDTGINDGLSLFELAGMLAVHLFERLDGQQ